MKRGYALKESQRAKRVNCSEKSDKNEHQTKRPGKCASLNATTIPFLKNFIVYKWLILDTVDE